MDPNIIFALVGLIIGLAKGGIGGPVVGALTLALLTQIMPVASAAGFTLPLLIIGDIFAVSFYWREWDWRLVRLLLPAALVGTLIGAFLLTSLPDDILRKILGFLSLAVVVYKIANERLSTLEYEARDWHGWVAGFTGGFGSALANVGGPPITAYLLLQRMKPANFVGTLAIFFFILNIVKMPIFGAGDILDIPLLLSIAWIIPLIPFGVWFGRRIIHWIDPRAFDIIMTVLLIWAALSLLFG